MAPPKKRDETSSEESSSDESVDIQPVVRKRFDDEDDSSDVAENWDEAEDSEEERAKAAKAEAARVAAAAEAAKNHKTKAQRVEEHREANRRRKVAEGDETDESSDEEDADRRARLKKSEQDSDLKHAEDLFSAVDLGAKRTTDKAVVVEDKNNPGQAIDLSSLPIFKPSTKGQFESLSEVLVPLLRGASSKPHYSIWMSNFVKQICADMPSAEIKKVASALTALSNEKMKEEKAGEKGGKKSKAAKQKVTLGADRNMARGVADTNAYDGDLGEDDFM